MTLWFDVEDLIAFFQHESRPTGIQRLSFEIYRELWKLGGPSGIVRFCRHGATEAKFYVVDWPTLETAIGSAIAASSSGSVDIPFESTEERSGTQATELVPGKADRLAIPLDAESPSRQLNLKGRIHRYLFVRIEPTIRTPLGILYRAQKQSLLAMRDLIKALGLVAARPRSASVKLGDVAIPLSNEVVQFAPEDMFISLGASWVLPKAASGRYLQKRYGIRFAVLIHDLIPELYPEWTSQEGLPLYRAWLRDVVPYADVIFSNSHNTARDLIQRMAEWNKPIPTPVVLPIGHYPPSQHEDGITGNVVRIAVQKKFDRPFILFVSTIEVRKNHALLFRVWRRLLTDMPSAEVPYLVFAGKTGWLTENFMAQLESAGWLNGHIKMVRSPSEQQLAALYEACEFTVFPSLYEGWGLPVTESLSFGKTVAASNSAAIVEAGGNFCSYFDPENVADAYKVIRGLIENPDRVRQLEARIRTEFRPPSWNDTAVEVLGHLQAATRHRVPKKAG